MLAHNQCKNIPPKGFKETNELGLIHGQKDYKKGNYYYSKDVGIKEGGTHNGGEWKVFKGNGNKLKRIGTADENLNLRTNYDRNKRIL